MALRLVPLLVALCACTPEEEGPITVRFVTPQDGDVVCGDPFTGTLALTNFVLEDAYSDDPADVASNRGHGHIYMNGQEVVETYADDFVADEPVEDGAYQLKVDLAHLDHSPVEPYVSDLIYITVDNTLCEAEGS